MSANDVTDAEFLQYIYDELGDDNYVLRMKRVYEEIDRDSQFRLLVAAGLFGLEQRKEFEDLVGETFSFERAFRGRFINSVTEMALTVIGTDRGRLEHIPVGLLPSGELNACAVLTPRGGAVIVLNQGLIGRLALICRCTLAFVTWNSDEPFSQDASQAAYAESLIGLAESLTTGDMSFLASHLSTLRFPSLPLCDETTDTFLTLMELFVLLHEYGHVVRGHLNGESVRPAFGDESSKLQEFNKSEEEEFEADEYAIEQLLRAGHEDGLLPSDIAFTAGLVMKFFQLCEVISEFSPSSPRTHPPAKDRWARIKRQTALDQTSSLAAELDPAFEAIETGWRLKKGLA